MTEVPLQLPEQDINTASLAYRAGHFIGSAIRNQRSQTDLGYGTELGMPNEAQVPEKPEATIVQEEDVVQEVDPERIKMDDVRGLFEDIDANLAAEVSELKANLDALREKDDRRWNLKSKVGSRFAGHDPEVFGSFRAIDQHQERLSNAIDRRYGKPAETSRQIEKLERNLYKKQAQRDNLRHGFIVEYEEDTDPRLFKKYLADPDEDLGDDFHLPYNPNPPTDPEEAQRLLRTLPFISNWEIRNPGKMEEVPEIVLKGNWQFPMDRIIGIDTFKDWSERGRGYGKSFTPVNLPNVEKSSRGAVTDYAQANTDWLTEKSAYGNGIDLRIIVDADGEYWGVVSGGGSHSTAAAKLRGERNIPVGSINIRPEGFMPQVPFSVKEEFSKRASKLRQS